MENASKALLIAGAVLITIFVISLAISIVTSNSEITNQASSTMETTAVYTFNQQFLFYLDDSATATTAKALTDKILQHNSVVNSSSFSPGNHHIYLNFYPKGESKITHKWKTADLKKIYNKISNGSRYKIYVTNCTTHIGGYYNGYVVCLSIREL